MHFRLFGDELTLDQVDLRVRFRLGVREDVPRDAQLIVVHDGHVVRLEVVAGNLLLHVLLQLLKLLFSHINGIPHVQSDLQRVEPSVSIRTHIIGRHVVFAMLHRIVVPHRSPVLNRDLVVREVHTVSRINLQKFIDLVLQVSIVHFLQVILSDPFLQLLEPGVYAMKLSRSVCI